MCSDRACQASPSGTCGVRQGQASPSGTIMLGVAGPGKSQWHMCGVAEHAGQAPDVPQGVWQGQASPSGTCVVWRSMQGKPQMCLRGCGRARQVPVAHVGCGGACRVSPRCASGGVAGPGKSQWHMWGVAEHAG